MGKISRITEKVWSGRSDRNIRFADLRLLLVNLGFDLRIKGDHHIFSKSGVEEIINLQPIGSEVKAYQVKQVRELVIKYKLEAKDE